jgi:hypothetical protein
MSMPPARVVALGLACFLLALPLYEDLAQVWTASGPVTSTGANSARATRVNVRTCAKLNLFNFMLTSLALHHTQHHNTTTCVHTRDPIA